MKTPKKSFLPLPVKAGYERWAEIYDCDGNPLIALEEPVIKRLAGNVAGLKVADIGCGTGRHSVALARLGAQVTAVDFCEAMLRRARKKSMGLGIRFLCRDITTTLPCADAAFDLVLCCLVAEHVRNLAAFFKELGRICKKDGAIIISVMHPALWLKGQSARFFDPKTGQEVRPLSYRRQLSDYVMAALEAGLALEHLSEHVVDEKLARKAPRAGKHVGWPILAVMRLRRTA